MILGVIFFACFVVLLALLVSAKKSLLRTRFELDREKEEKNIVIDFLHVLTEDIGNGSVKEKIFSRIVRATALSCGALSACVYERLKDGSLKMKASEGLFPPLKKINPIKNQKGERTKLLETIMNETSLEADEGLIGMVARERKGILIRNAEKDPRVVKQDDESLKIVSLIIVPMIFRGELYGVLALANPIGEKSFSETDFSLAMSLAEQGALAINNTSVVSALIEKNKLDFDLRLASSVQRYLLPSSLPNISGLDFAVNYIPQQLIGGDFYDFINLPDGILGVVIADVSGKGISAAILMALCQTKMKYIACNNPHSPAEALKKLNAEMVKAMREDMFITMIYATISADGSTVKLSRAGHEAALFYKSRDGKVEEIRPSGMAVGMVESELFDSSVGEISFKLESGDALTLYTDGISEAQNSSGEEFSKIRLEKILQNLNTKTAAEINEGMISEMEKFSKGAKSDDITLLTIKKS